MAKKRSSRPSTATGVVTADRAARLYRLLQFLRRGPQTRDALTRHLGCDVRSFYRDLQLLRGAGIDVPLRNRRYTLEEEAEEVIGRLPFYPEPPLTLGEAVELAKGRSAAHRKLKDQIARIVEPSSKSKAAK